MRDPQGEPLTWFYHFGLWLTRTLMNLFSRWRVVGTERVPLHGPLLVVCNHQNNADPSIVVAMIPRAVHCMAKEELFWWPLRILSRLYGAFPVRRGHADRQAIRTALGHLKRGSCVLMFPEGTRSRTGGLLQGQLGAGLIAERAGAQILPVGMIGTGRLRNWRDLLRRHQIEIVIGEPFVVPKLETGSRAEAAVVATDLIMRRIGALLPLEQRGVYGEPVSARVEPEREIA